MLVPKLELYVRHFILMALLSLKCPINKSEPRITLLGRDATRKDTIWKDTRDATRKDTILKDTTKKIHYIEETNPRRDISQKGHNL